MYLTIAFGDVFVVIAVVSSDIGVVVVVVDLW